MFIILKNKLITKILHIKFKNKFINTNISYIKYEFVIGDSRMKNKILISGLIIAMMISLIALPVMSNSISKSDNIYRKNNGLDAIGFYFSKVDISGVGEYNDEVPGLIYWNLTEGQISINALFSNNHNKFPDFPYKFFDNYNTTDPSNGFLMMFIGTKSNNPFEIHGFAVLTITTPN
jgi:hypothetical protein